MAVLNDQFRDEDGRIDFSALGKEEYTYRMALIQGRLSKSPRAAEAYADASSRYAANVANGSKGGRPRKQQLSSVRVSGSGDAPVPVTSEAISSPDGTDELYAFAAANDLDEIDAREWYEMSEKRGWKDRYGNPIRDWELACEAYCARKALNRLKKEAK